MQNTDRLGENAVKNPSFTPKCQAGGGWKGVIIFYLRPSQLWYCGDFTVYRKVTVSFLHVFVDPVQPS